MMNSTTTPFNKIALALLFSVTGMLLSLSALAIATDSVKQEQHVVELSVSSSSVATTAKEG